VKRHLQQFTSKQTNHKIQVLVASRVEQQRSSGNQGDHPAEVSVRPILVYFLIAHKNFIQEITNEDEDTIRYAPSKTQLNDRSSTGSGVTDSSRSTYITTRLFNQRRGRKRKQEITLDEFEQLPRKRRLTKALSHTCK
jgi:hypothetical protein